MKNDDHETEKKVNNILKINSSSLKQEQNINNNETKENLLVKEKQCIKSEDNNLEKNEDIKTKLEKEIEKCEENNTVNVTLIPPPS